MSTGSLVSEPKRKKLNGRNTCLDDLPDETLGYILSFLPTKCAVGTCILSKRWQYLWTLLSSLDFHDNVVHKFGKPGEDEITKIKNFMNFVESVLIHDALRIQKFSLSCNVLEDEVSRVKTWISNAVSRNAKEVHIHFNYEKWEQGHGFPDCLFNCGTVEVLKIKADVPVQLPSQIWELIMDSCLWEGGLHDEVVISAPNLWSLAIDDSGNEENFWVLGLLYHVTISAPMLKNFEYTGGFLKDYRFSQPSSISKASLLFEYGHMSNLGGDFLIIFSQGPKIIEISETVETIN
ncbi:putative F-box protein At3g44060 [Rutidosis leptorrhynchoides]|uniref:putative F-box protein At3g44060 n=1 Tax=Rutidosis leptorrhynchoides TaxID=125765 RepID=UPI003A99F468